MQLFFYENKLAIDHIMSYSFDYVNQAFRLVDLQGNIIIIHHGHKNEIKYLMQKKNCLKNPRTIPYQYSLYKG